MASAFIQVRTNEDEKKKAAAILERLGTNLSAVVNMLIRQIIETESIPFEVNLKHQTPQEKAEEEIRTIMEAVLPQDTIQLALDAGTPEERIFYERLGDYLLQVGQRMAIERNVF